jgi:hypothetical protein
MKRDLQAALVLYSKILMVLPNLTVNLPTQWPTES